MNAAERLLDALDHARSIPPLTDAEPTLDDERAYAIAREIHDRRVARGEHPIGRKIGFTNRNIWPEYGVYQPIWAHVYDSTVAHAEGDRATVRVSDLPEPRIEPEIVLHFARKPAVTRDPEAILASIDWIAHGFEIVQSVFPAWKFRAPDTMAAFALHGRLVVGTPVPVAGIADCAAKLAGFRIALLRGGAVQAEGGGANVLDSPLLAFAHLADLLLRQPGFAPVQAGEIVTTGTLTAALPVKPGETWSTRLDGLELPGLSITLT
jgi:2-oxo-3-hexenedioate decarboxylase